MAAVKRSEDQGFLPYQTSCALIAALAGLNVGWHISTFLSTCRSEPAAKVL